MIMIRDEQIVAAVYIVMNWSSFTIGFLHSLYASTFVNALTSAGIIWQNITDKNRLEFLATKYPNHFLFESGVLKCIKSQEECFNAFIDSLPEDIQRLIASLIASTFKR